MYKWLWKLDLKRCDHERDFCFLVNKVAGLDLKPNVYGHAEMQISKHTRFYFTVWSIL